MARATIIVRFNDKGDGNRRGKVKNNVTHAH